MIKLALPSALALLAGVSVVVQQALNANLRSELSSAAWSGFMSYLLGLMCMTVLAVALRDPVPSTAVLARIPPWAWSGGIFGAIFIGLSIIVAHKLGAGALVVLLVTGQMIAAMVLDHFGWLGMPQRPIDFSRVVGVGLLIAGVLLFQR